MNARYFTSSALNYSYHTCLLIFYLLWRHLFAELFWSSITTQQAFITAYLVYFGYFWLFATPYLLLTYFKKPHWIYSKYKIQVSEKTNISAENTVTYSSLKNCIKVVLFNQICGTAPIIYLYYKYFSYYYSINDVSLPSIPVSLLYVFLFIALYEIVFYSIHCLFHINFLYSYKYHKLHHQYQETICIVTHYVSFVEHLLVNLLPFLIGPVLTFVHLDIACFWTIIAITSAINGHSGFSFPFITESNSHDFHHYNFTGNYGVTGAMDALFGTDTEYKMFVESKLHL